MNSEGRISYSKEIAKRTQPRNITIFIRLSQLAELGRGRLVLSDEQIRKYVLLKVTAPSSRIAPACLSWGRDVRDCRRPQFAYSLAHKRGRSTKRRVEDFQVCARPTACVSESSLCMREAFLRERGASEDGGESGSPTRSRVGSRSAVPFLRKSE